MSITSTHISPYIHFDLNSENAKVETGQNVKTKKCLTMALIFAVFCYFSYLIFAVVHNTDDVCNLRKVTACSTAVIVLSGHSCFSPGLSSLMTHNTLLYITD